MIDFVCRNTRRLLAAVLPAIAAALFTIAASPSPRAQVAVDLELILAVDVSRSVDADEAALQRQGYMAAFTDPQVQAAMFGGANGRIAVAYVEWAGFLRQVTIDWTLIDTPAAAKAFADTLATKPILSESRTSISGAIDFAKQQFGRGYAGVRRVIDISGDGANNFGRLVTEARDEAVAAGITINGLPILNDRGGPMFSTVDLDIYYENCVIGGPGSFMIAANGFDEFGQAIRRKLTLELAGRQPARPLLHRVAETRRTPSCDVGERQWRGFMGDRW